MTHYTITPFWYAVFCPSQLTAVNLYSWLLCVLALRLMIFTYLIYIIFYNAILTGNYAKFQGPLSKAALNNTGHLLHYKRSLFNIRQCLRITL